MRKTFIIFFAVFYVVPLHAMSVINDTQIEKHLYKLITPVAVAANVPENRLKIHIVNDDTFNAFVTGGQDVFINTGLLTRIKNPNALQSVVAHELGHMIGGHMAQMSARMDAEIKRTLMIQALGNGFLTRLLELPLEAIVVFVEGAVYARMLRSTEADDSGKREVLPMNPFGLSLILNAVSYGVGVLLDVISSLK